MNEQVKKLRDDLVGAHISGLKILKGDTFSSNEVVTMLSYKMTAAFDAGFQYRDAEVKMLKYALLEILHYSQDSDERREIARKALEGGETHPVRIKNLDGVNKDGV